jgi:hypothetical protein
MLSYKHLIDVCLLGSPSKSKTCRYLRNDEFDENKWYCQKLQHNAKIKIDKHVESASRDSIIPSGDNCCGYPLLKHIHQGYDVD